MKLVEFYHRIREDEWLQLRNIKVRFYIIGFFLLMAIVFLPLLGLQHALLPIILVCLIGLLSSVFHLIWEIQGKTLHYGLYFTYFVDVLFITIAIHYLGGIQTWFSWVYAVALIAISLVRGLRIGIYVAVISSLMNCALMVGEYTGVIPHVTYEFISPTFIHQGRSFLYIRLLGDTILFLLTAVVSGILSERLTEKGNELEKKNKEIFAMQKMLQEYASDLENTIAERTEELTTTNKELEKSFSLLRATLESTADGILVVDTKGNIQNYNQKLLEMWRISPDMIKSDENSQIRIHMLNQAEDPDEAFYQTQELYDLPDRENFALLKLKGDRIFERHALPQKIAGRTVGIVVSFRDVSEQKRLQQQLLQAQKMESIGTLAGGIAHDFNNLLGGILGFASLTKTKISRDHQIYEYLDTIERSATRAAELTSQLLAFARGGRYEVKPINLNNIIDETLMIIGRTFDKSIQIEKNLCAELPTVEADAGQLQQVIMNLCMNAYDAMDAGGKLIIQTDTKTVTEWYSEAHFEVKPGPYVTFSIMDTGVGIDKEKMQRIFEPFFTTKREGKGTGLGLSMVYGVVKNHGGFVNVYSELCVGTTFKVYLPASEKSEHEEQSETERPSGGSEMILVVDDEESIRTLIKEILESHGYEVMLTENGADAVAVYKEHRGKIDAVIIDMVMPKMGGREAFLKLKELDPGIIALLSTGYSKDGKAKAILNSGVKGFIQKPYQVDALLSKVRSVLDSD